jgi:hypothetical protein
MRRQTDHKLDMSNPDHRALVLRTYFRLVAKGEPPDSALIKAPHEAVERWREGIDCPGFYPRRTPNPGS